MPTAAVLTVMDILVQVVVRHFAVYTAASVTNMFMPIAVYARAYL